MRARRMIERLEQRRLLSCCGAGMAAMAHGAAAHAQIAAQLAEHYGQGQHGQQHMAQASAHGSKAIVSQNHMGNAGHKATSHVNHATTGHDHQTTMDDPVALRRGILMVRGTPGDDTVKIAPNADDPKRLNVTVNGDAQSFRRADVKQIHVMTGRGHDTVEIDPSLDIPSIINGRKVK